ncbi:MAG TPA: tyrosine-type recombinase/integrase, partial [Gemmataceae bacterium]|nr:tyrosine-type recombinase/integrase [Gemmataceae bacterium]
HERIVQCILGRKRNQKLAEFATCLHATGARPGELLMATATDWNDRLGALVYYADDRRLEGEARHKTAGKGKDRRIFFTGEALTIMRALVKKHPKGPLWRTRRGTPWNRTNMNASFQVVGERLGIEGLTPYSYRHTYATRWLEKGGSIDDLAALLGNTPAMIRKHYSHICDNVDRLRDLAEKFTATPTPEGRSETPSPAVLPFASGKEAV